MLSLQSHNQVLYHLLQWTSAKFTFFPVKVKQQNEFKKTVDDISSINFTDTKKIYKDIPIDKLTNQDVYTIFNRKNNNIRVIIDQISMKASRRDLKRTNKWKVSYVSGSSFTKNKQQFPCAQLTEPVILPVLNSSLKQHHRTLCTVHINNPFNYHVQIRNFKTKRSTNAEVEGRSLVNYFKNWLGHTSDPHTKLTYLLKEPNVEKIKFMYNNTEVSPEEHKKIRSAFIEGYEVGLQGHGKSRPVRHRSFTSVFVVCLILAVLWYTTSNPGKVFRLSMNQTAEINPETIHVTFSDVKGVEEAKQELQEIVEFLKNPEKFSALGAQLPKGVLLVGPPGTGKTLLARAVAGEAGVPFFHAAGAEFDEVLVGQGARRVRNLFKAAKERAPSVVFIDEIDSVGGKRTNSLLHPYANQTINQLLSEMDGFLKNEGVIVLGATNRPEDLDKALLRPGRFDVEVYVNKPDIIGRKDILDHYLSRIHSKDIDIEYLARSTAGFTGADLQNMVNQAALRAALYDDDYVTMKHLEYARDKTLMGPEGKLKAIDDEESLITAYHEAGHALVAYYTKDCVPIHKVTIIPRGPSLGHTSFLPNKDQYHVTKSQLLANMDSMMGGRAAEELIFGPDKVTTGAAGDFKQATTIAELMVKTYGMSEKVGFRVHPEKRQELVGNGDVGPNTVEVIDSEVTRLLQESYERAKTILKNHAKKHKKLAEALLKYETLDIEDVKAIVNGKKAPIEEMFR